MFSHICVGSNDLARSQRFYDAIFAASGGPEVFVIPGKGSLVYRNAQGTLLITAPADGNTATHANGGTIGLTLDSAAAVDAWHAAGVANGGTSCEDAPGLRPAMNLYLAYLRDPDGNKLCAVYRAPAQAAA